MKINLEKNNVVTSRLMNPAHFTACIEKALQAAGALDEEQPMIRETTHILHLLKEAVEKDSRHINERILRGGHDLGMASFKYFENTELEEALCAVTEVLYNEYPEYKNLEPLGLDYGQGDPV